MNKRIQIVVGLAIGAFFVWFLARIINWRDVGNALRDANWFWLGAGTAVIIVTFFTRVLRWGYIVRTAGAVSFRSMFSATQIGFMGNFVLPARAGEVIRAVVLNRLTGIPFAKCFAFVALDRVTDLFGLIMVMLVSVISFHPSADIVLPEELIDRAVTIPANAIRTGAFGVTFFLTTIIGCFVVLYVKQSLMLRISDRIFLLLGKGLADRVHSLLFHFAEGMHVFRSLADMAKAISLSLLTWMLAVLAYYCVIMAFGIVLPWYASFVIMSLMSVAISIPGPPGFIGPFHMAVVGGVLLLDPQADLDVAMAAAIMAHFINLLPIVLLGVYSMYREKFGFLELQRDSGEARSGK